MCQIILYPSVIIRIDIIVVTTISKFSNPTHLRTNTTIKGSIIFESFFANHLRIFADVTCCLSFMYASLIQKIKSRTINAAKIAATSQPR
jgi:hypothetical protein